MKGIFSALKASAFVLLVAFFFMVAAFAEAPNPGAGSVQGKIVLAQASNTWLP